MKSKTYSDAVIMAGLRAARGLVFIAAEKIGCSAETIYSRLKAVPAVKQALEESRGLLLDKGEDGLAAAVEAGEPWAIQYLLSTLGKSRGYVKRSEHTGADGGPIRFVRGLFDDDGPEPAEEGQA